MDKGVRYGANVSDKRCLFAWLRTILDPMPHTRHQGPHNDAPRSRLGSAPPGRTGDKAGDNSLKFYFCVLAASTGDKCPKETGM